MTGHRLDNPKQTNVARKNAKAHRPSEHGPLLKGFIRQAVWPELNTGWIRLLLSVTVPS